VKLEDPAWAEGILLETPSRIHVKDKLCGSYHLNYKVIFTSLIPVNSGFQFYSHVFTHKNMYVHVGLKQLSSATYRCRANCMCQLNTWADATQSRLTKETMLSYRVG